MRHTFKIRFFMLIAGLAVLATLQMLCVSALRAQASNDWGSEAELCPATVGMYAEHNGEQFAGTAVKERETFFWARYHFVAYNQGGVGAIEMSGFFYVSKAQCFFQGDKGVFMIASPVIEYYGPVRDSCGSGGSGGGGNPAEGETVMSTSFHTSCGGGGGGEPGGSTTRCYTVRLDHYYYDPDTGESTYRYSEAVMHSVYLGCRFSPCRIANLTRVMSATRNGPSSRPIWP